MRDVRAEVTRADPDADRVAHLELVRGADEVAVGGDDDGVAAIEGRERRQGTGPGAQVRQLPVPEKTLGLDL